MTITFSLVIFSITACSVTPYRDKFACSLRDDFGKCIGVEGAYNEAVSGVDSGAPTLSRKGPSVMPVPDSSISVDDADVPTVSTSPGTSNQTIKATMNQADRHGAYRSAKYQQMRSMLTSPTAPMVQPAKTVRTLIISYSNKVDGNRLYMPRYVFTISEQPQFVLGDYLNYKDQLIDERTVMIDNGMVKAGETN